MTHFANGECVSIRFQKILTRRAVVNTGPKYLKKAGSLRLTIPMIRTEGKRLRLSNDTTPRNTAKIQVPRGTDQDSNHSQQRVKNKKEKKKMRGFCRFKVKQINHLRKIVATIPNSKRPAR